MSRIFQELYHRMVTALQGRGATATLTPEEEADARSTFEETFGPMFQGASSPAQGKRAEALYARERPARILVISQPDPRFTPHQRSSPFAFALSCALQEGMAPPPLGEFSWLEPCAVADDFAWVMVHTHEDRGFGGPYFARAESIYPGPRRPPR
jgi:hypothetical protein